MFGVAFSAFEAYFLSQPIGVRRQLLADRFVAVIQSRPAFVRAVRESLPPDSQVAFDVLIGTLTDHLSARR